MELATEEQVLDEETWPQEAAAAIKDIINHVRAASVSDKIKNTNQRIYINLTTLEGVSYCVEMSSTGFKIVGKNYDEISIASNDGIHYETPYALLNEISPEYRKSFGGELMSKLLDLAKSSEHL